MDSGGGHRRKSRSSSTCVCHVSQSNVQRASVMSTYTSIRECSSHTGLLHTVTTQTDSDDTMMPFLEGFFIRHQLGDVSLCLLFLPHDQNGPFEGTINISFVYLCREGVKESSV